ncbi:AAA family ATPase [Streptomyces sp. NPDC001380]|uniref:AAA family ATPase n=1 Tax=Streptomyces sp. NPDC001380 TaxID=3364566 RepID=UPI00368C5E87
MDEARATAGVLRPQGVQDLRGRGAGRELHYPAGDLLVVSGLPGSGKSTLIGRAVPPGVRRIDSHDVRADFARRLPDRLPYAVYRPLVRAVHYWRLRGAVRGGGPVVVHDCGERGWVRGWLGRRARRQGRGLHLLLLDVDPEQASGGQRARGRAVSAAAFARHLAGWRRLLAEVERAAPGGRLPGGAVSVVLLDRAGAGPPLLVRFGGERAGGGLPAGRRPAEELPEEDRSRGGRSGAVRGAP